MTQQLSPWLETAYGWAYGENGWNTGMDSNLLKFSVMFDRNVDSITASLPPAVNGQVHYNTSDNRIYFAVNTTYFSTPVPKWFTVIVRSTGVTWQFNGVSLIQVDSVTSLDTRLDAVEVTLSTLGSAAFEDVGFFATQPALDLVEAQTQAYTDVLRGDLVSTNGADNVGFLQAGTGAVARTTQSKLRDAISVLDYMSEEERADTLLLTPLLNHTPALQKAIDASSSGLPPSIRGKRILLPGGRNFRLATNLTLRSGTCLVGEFTGVPDNYSAVQPVIPSTVYLANGVTITGQIGVNLHGLVIMKEGLTFPQDSTQVAAWTDTAITLPNNGASIENCLIVGFNQAVLAVNHSRLRVTNTLIDCLNGIDNSGSFDLTYLNRVHCWPYASITSGSTNDLKRAGIAFKLHEVADWAKLTDCFSYGYLTGFHFENVGAITVLSCSADNVVGHVGAVGFKFIGTTTGEIRLIAPQSAAQAIGIYINASHTTPQANSFYIINPSCWANSANGIEIDSAADVHISGGKIRNSPNGIVLNNSSASGSIKNVTFTNDITTTCIQHVASGPNWDIRGNVYQAGGTGRMETAGKTAGTTVISATLLPNRYRDITLFSGTVVVTSVDSTWAEIGDIFTARFTSAGSTITHSGSLTLKSGANVTTVVNQVMRFQYFGNNVWVEV